MKILISVLTYLDDDIYSKFYEVQNKTWDSLDVDNVETFYYVGNGDKKEVLGKLVINDLPELVENEGYKFINFLTQTFDKEYDYVYHTNSSSYVDKELLYEWLLDKPRDNFYSGVIGNWGGYNFASGCGFTLSKDLVKLILDNQDMWSHGDVDDATLGVMMNHLGKTVYPAPRFDITTTKITTIPTNYFHYRCKTIDRNFDIESMIKIFDLKKSKI
jgi:hypothetical protein